MLASAVKFPLQGPLHNLGPLSQETLTIMSTRRKTHKFKALLEAYKAAAPGDDAEAQIKAVLACISTLASGKDHLVLDQGRFFTRQIPAKAETTRVVGPTKVTKTFPATPASTALVFKGVVTPVTT